ncbi:MAG: homoserine dehydrogenase [Chloroflexi bacterium]|nr:MAG: homoserine dehydrogenase [Phototrophicales bacterium]RMF80660.1 MAG: homoserine dehydrogenase [Chloroflexota bacterium]
MRLILIGFGVVGQGLARILRDKRDDLKQRYNFTSEIVAVITGSRGTLYRPDGLDIAQLLSAIEAGSLSHYPKHDGLIRDWDALRIIREGEADVIVEASPTNLETAQPALDYCVAALESGKHIVTANKGPIALAYHDLMVRAKAAGRQVLYEATVMAGTPALRLGVEALAGCTVSEVRGILNGTTNYILTQMENGMDYAEALAQAQQLGYAETDPAGDVEGWDAAAKVIILALTFFGKKLTLNDMDVRGITGITVADVREAQAAGERWKLMASVTADGGRVQPVRIPMSDPLAGVASATNAITFVTDLMGEVTLVGAGAGQTETGFALLADLLALHRG